MLIESIKYGKHILTYNNKLILQMFSIKIKKPKANRLPYTKNSTVKNAERKAMKMKEVMI